MSDLAFLDFETAMKRNDGEFGVFHQGYVDGWSDGRWERLSSQRVWEADYTSLLAAASGALEAQLTALLMEAAGVEADASLRYRIVRASDLGAARRKLPNGKLNTQVPDLFVASSAADPAEHVSWIPEVAIEAKFSGYVNGDYAYCPSGLHPGYSNQIVCYIDNCWLSRDAVPPKAYLWLGHAGADPTANGRGISERDADARGFHKFKGDQDSCWKRWKKLDHQALIGAKGPFNRAGVPELAAYLRSCAPFN